MLRPLPPALLIEVAAAEDELIAAGRVPPFAIRLAVKEHVNPALRLTCEADEALHAEDVHPALTEQYGKPGVEPDEIMERRAKLLIEFESGSTVSWLTRRARDPTGRAYVKYG